MRSCLGVEAIRVQRGSFCFALLSLRTRIPDFNCRIVRDLSIRVGVRVRVRVGVGVGVGVMVRIRVRPQ